MSVGAGLYMYDIVVKSSRSLSHLMSSCFHIRCVPVEARQKFKCKSINTDFYRIWLIEKKLFWCRKV